MKSTNNSPITICEIGCNHKGDMKIALEMIKIAAEFCNVDVIKFQKRTNTELLSQEEYNSPHPMPDNSYGSTYGEHREFLELTLDENLILKKECEKYNVIYSTSVWDLTSAKEITSINPELIKIPSAINTNNEVLSYLYSNYDGEIHISLGMTMREEEENIVERNKDVTLYHCISSYPVETKDLYLLEISRLIDSYKDIVKNIGFSGHHKGISADIAALTLGATHFERHFTLDRTWKGTDHAASLEPDGFRRLSRDLKSVSAALKNKPEEILDIEKNQRKKLKRLD